ncbi:MAG: ABC transporter permease [Gaiellales bacterium]
MITRRVIRRYRARRAPAPSQPRVAKPTRGDRGPVGLVLHQAWYDLLAFWRNRQARFFTLLLPLIFLVIFVSVFGNHTIGQTNIKTSTYYVPGIATLAVIASSFVNLVITITTQRETGIFKRRRATPMPAWALILGRMLSAIAVAVAVMTMLLAIGWVAYGVRLATSTIPGIAITAVIGAATFCILGYALSTAINNADSAQPMVQAIMLPLYFISGVFIPNVNLPSWLRGVSRFFPVEHLADALHHAYVPGTRGIGLVWSDLAVLGLWAAAGLVIALRRFSWLPHNASG